MAKTKRRSGQSAYRSAQTKKSTQENTATEITSAGKVIPSAAKETAAPQSKLERPSSSPEVSRAAARSQIRTNTRQRYQKKKSNPWLLIGSVLLVLVVIVGFFIYLSNQSSGNVTTGEKPTDPVVLKIINNVDPAILEAVNTGGITDPIVATKGAPAVLKGPTGKPELFYDGAEYCPYCAAQRWSTAVALSRFGTFTKLPETTSSSSDIDPSTSTLSFYGSTYSSSYIDFVSVEETTNQSDGNGGYTLLQTPTADETKIVQTYNAAPYTTSPGIPFMSIANQYLQLGPSYDPATLAGLSQQDIANDLSNSSSTVTKNILGGANYLTAAICAVTNNQPASVCTTGAIPSIEKSLPKAQASTQIPGAQTGIAAEPNALPGRKED